MDGTLVDSDAAVERAWRTWATGYQADPRAVLAVAHGQPADTTVRQMLPGLGDADVEVAAQRQLALQYDDLCDVIATPGAAELLVVLDQMRIPWAVVTSADRQLATARLAKAGCNPAIVITVEDVNSGKPDPEGYLLAADRLGVAPAHCLVVEDSGPGVAAGHAAGAIVASLKNVPADIALTDLGQLVALLTSSSPS